MVSGASRNSRHATGQGRRPHESSGGGTTLPVVRAPGRVVLPWFEAVPNVVETFDDEPHTPLLIVITSSSPASRCSAPIWKGTPLLGTEVCRNGIEFAVSPTLSRLGPGSRTRGSWGRLAIYHRPNSNRCTISSNSPASTRRDATKTVSEKPGAIQTHLCATHRSMTSSTR